jgi:hypothetical protein
MACSIVDRVCDVAGLDVVTTTSPFLARVLKQHRPELELRASVNMRIGTVQGMEYLAEVFDGFHMQRDCNRDFARIEELSAWCSSNGKGLFLLANSGCLRFCSTQTFHDNMVAHETEILETVNLHCRVLACHSYLREPEHWPAILQATWVRPEDLHHYESRFPLVKLATRMHANPSLVIGAYARRSWGGNLLDLLEPGHTALLDGKVIDNMLFPEDWFAHTTACSRKCHSCAYCRDVLNRVLHDRESAGEREIDKPGRGP